MGNILRYGVFKIIISWKCKYYNHLSGCMNMCQGRCVFKNHGQAETREKVLYSFHIYRVSALRHKIKIHINFVRRILFLQMYWSHIKSCTKMGSLFLFHTKVLDNILRFFLLTFFHINVVLNTPFYWIDDIFLRKT